MKKIIAVAFVIIVLSAVGISVLSRQAPGLLVRAIERSLQKKVSIGAVHYRFPSLFEIENFAVAEDEPFAGEPSFQVGLIRLAVSPFSLYQGRLVIDRLEVKHAKIAIRRYRGKLLHVLSNAAAGGEVSQAPSKPAEPKAARSRMPLSLKYFRLEASEARFVDYDIQEGGFVLALENLEAQVKHIELPPAGGKTTFQISAKLTQGRDQRPALFNGEGWTHLSSRDTQMNIAITGVFLPYFRPYYSQVTPALLDQGYMDARLALGIESRQLKGAVDFELTGLLFQAYEMGNQLFNMRADEVLSFMKDSSGRLKFQITFGWNLNDRSVNARDILRQSIESALKQTVIRSVGNLLSGIDSKDGLQNALEKAKQLFG
ncbi:MAG: DUF748 domain-containing protein [Candidatus Omnitrophica bacterium]|nr:DUF748 domain-containing protein [Candidatus Omnitrophota bacterium]